MITDFFLDLFENVGMWVIGLIPETGGEVGQVQGATSAIGPVVGQLAGFFGALNRWFPVVEFFALGLAATAVEVVIMVVRGIRILKQLLPFQ